MSYRYNVRIHEAKIDSKTKARTVDAKFIWEGSFNSIMERDLAVSNYRAKTMYDRGLTETEFNEMYEIKTETVS